MKPSRKQTEQNEQLADLISLDLSQKRKKEQFDNIIMILSACLDMPIAYISSMEPEDQKILASYGLHPEQAYKSASFCDHTLLQKETLVVEDTLKDNRFSKNPMVVNAPKIRFYASFPLISTLGNLVGSLCVADRVPRKFTEKQHVIFETIGSLLLERIRMFKLGSLQEQIHASQKTLSKVNKELNRNNKFYKQLFGQYMSDGLLDAIIQKNKKTHLGGEKRFATVLMSDIRGFSTISERYEPEFVVEILNTYFEEMIDVIHQHDGYINEILGDGILVVFGAPNHLSDCAKKAIDCSRAMQERISMVNHRLKARDLPELEMGIGINSGDLVAGNIGSQKRMKYGVIGESVNLAARLQALAIGGQILISNNTYEKVKDWVNCIGRLRVQIKGITNHVLIHDISVLEQAKMVS